MRDVLITFGLWLVADRLLVFAAEALESKINKNKKKPSLTVEACVTLLKKIIDLEYPTLFDVKRVVNDENRQSVVDALTTRAREIESAVCSSQGVTTKDLTDAIAGHQNESLSLLYEEFSYAFRNAISGDRVPQMPSLMGYLEELLPDDRDKTYELIKHIQDQYRQKLIEVVRENWSDLMNYIPSSAEEYSLDIWPLPIRNRMRRMLVETQEYELARVNMPVVLFLHNVAVLSNSETTNAHIRSLHSIHKQLLFEQLNLLRFSQNQTSGNEGMKST